MRSIKAFFVILVVALGLFVCGCQGKISGPGLAFQELIKAAESKNSAQVESFLAEDFTSDVDRSRLMSWVNNWFSQPSSIRINVLSQEIKHRGHGATIRATVAISSGPLWFPKRVRRVHVETEWMEEDGQWKVRVAQWRRI